MRTGKLIRRLALSGAALAIALSTATVAVSAATGVWKDIPDYGSSDGEAVIDDSNGFGDKFRGHVKFNRVGGSYCTYIQAKGVLVLGLDSSWFRLTPNRCSSTTTKVTYEYFKDFLNGYDGLAFRICGDKSWDTDPCGASVTVYR